MVKKPSEVCLNPYEPIAFNKNDRNEKEVVTIPDVSPSLYQMVVSGNVGSMPGNNSLYQYPDLGDDDDAHDHPDYMKLDQLDIVEKEEYVNKFTENPNNYEKIVSEKTAPEEEGDSQSEVEQTEQKA